MVSVAKFFHFPVKEAAKQIKTAQVHRALGKKTWFPKGICDSTHSTAQHCRAL